jgi:hypothetical protein
VLGEELGDEELYAAEGGGGERDALVGSLFSGGYTEYDASVTICKVKCTPTTALNKAVGQLRTAHSAMTYHCTTYLSTAQMLAHNTQP